METITWILAFLFAIQLIIIIGFRADFNKYKAANEATIKNLTDYLFKHDRQFSSIQEGLTITDNKRSDDIRIIKSELEGLSTTVTFCTGVLGIKKFNYGSFNMHVNNAITPVNQSKRLLALEKHLNLEYKTETTEGYVLRETPQKEDAI